MNALTHDSTARELDYRINDGIEVRLLWNPVTSRVSINVDDTRLGDSFEFQVAAADALVAFRHPFGYANRDDTAHPIAA